MTTKLEERGRGKFKPAPDYTLEDVKEIMYEKIQEETNLIIDEPNTYDTNDLVYKDGKANITSLFSGAGGLDLGVELAGLDCVIGENKTNNALKNKKILETVRNQ